VICGEVEMRRRFVTLLALAGIPLASCSLQGPYQRPGLTLAPQWANATADIAPSPGARAVDPRWWTQLRDPAVDVLTDAALVDNPTLAEAAAAVDEARARLRVAQAQRTPELGIDGAAARARIASPASPGGPSVLTVSSAAIGANLGWELDLWGRLRQSALAARQRLDARTADAAGARLALVAQITDGVESLRACGYSLAVRDSDIASRETELALTRQRLRVGNVAPVDEAGAEANLASARTDRIRQAEQCARSVDILVELSGRDAAAVRSLVATPAPASELTASEAGGGIPKPPPVELALPATVLLNHPEVIAAEREAQARWAEIAVARAERLPRLDLLGLLTGNWLRAFGSDSSFGTWSAGGILSLPAFDGGAGAAKVRLAEARYREAVAQLRAAIRVSARDVEDALAAQQSAGQRVETSRQAVEAARIAFVANEARWRAGAVSRFELEDSRRQFNLVQESAIAAARDSAQAWVDLIRASGSAAPTAMLRTQTPTKDSSTEAP